MANEISTAGITIQYAVESTIGTKPTSGYTAIPNIKSIGDMNPQPSTYEVTDLSDTVWKRYINGLKDPGGAIALTANITDTFKTAWETLVSAWSTGKASGYATWFEIVVPGITESFYIAAEPSDLGFPAVDTDAVFEGDVYITPNQVGGWDTAST